MALFNYATREITLKIVYYGPGLSGKTTNLQYLHGVLNPKTKGKLLSLSTESDRTLFFDFLPVELGKIRDFAIRFQLYTVPGQVRYNATRKVVLKGADAVIFVADSQTAAREQNRESFANMRENLSANNIDPDDLPVVLQYNKRDLKNILSTEDLNGDLNSFNYPVVEAVALTGVGVEDSFKLVTKLLLKHISKKHKIEFQPSKEKEMIAPQVESEIKPERRVEPVETPAQFVAPPVAPLYAKPPKQQTITPYEREEPAPQAAPEVEPEPAIELEEIPPEPPAPEAKPSFAEPLEQPVLTRYELEEKITREEVSEAHSSGIAEASPESEIYVETGKPPRTRMAEQIEIFPPPPEVREGSAVTVEKLHLMAQEVSKMNLILIELKKSLSVLSKEVKEMKGMKKEQEEIGKALRDILRTLGSLKTKKSWFRL